jgi:hypothetical protein
MNSLFPTFFGTTQKYTTIRGVGCMDVGETLLPYRNSTSIFQQISKKFSYFKILINLRTYKYITYNENIASFNVLHNTFIRIYQLFSCWILAYETRLEAKPVVLPSPSFFPQSLGRKLAFVCQVASWIPLLVLKDEVCG